MNEVPSRLWTHDHCEQDSIPSDRLYQKEGYNLSLGGWLNGYAITKVMHVNKKGVARGLYAWVAQINNKLTRRELSPR